MAKKKPKAAYTDVTEITRHQPHFLGGRGKSAVETASKSLRELRIAEVSKL